MTHMTRSFRAAKVAAATFVLLASCTLWAQDAASKPAPQLPPGQKWVFTFSNLANDAGLQKDIALMKRAKAAGYNGILVSDTKFDKFQLYGPELAANCKKLREACTAEKMQLICGATPFGYANDYLTHDPNLAEGLPVRKAAFVVKDGKLVPDDEGVKLDNGSFEHLTKGIPSTWNMDEPGKLCVADDSVASDGKTSLRMQDPGAGGKDKTCRVWQKVKVKPWHYYHISAKVKTENWTGKDMRVMGHAGNPDGVGMVLNHQPLDIKPTQDWTEVHGVFSSMEYTEVAVYLGTWGGKEGKIWWDDVKLEPGGFVNAIRRESCPLVVTSADGKTTYVEGKDFSEVKDSKLIHDPNPGYFTLWHAEPVVTVPAGSKLKEGDKVLATYTFTTSSGKPGQLNMCMAEPKAYEIVQKQIEWMKANLNPDIYLLAHDEIRIGGWDDSCAKTGKTPGQILADNIRKCIEITKKVDPGKPIVIWNDMFDPYHNAKPAESSKDFFYLVKGMGPWAPSWEGVSSDVIVANWRQNKADSLKFFADRGEQQLLAGYYDKDPALIVDWLKTAKDTKGVVGVIYTTWRGEYKDLEKFIEHVNKFEAGK